MTRGAVFADHRGSKMRLGERGTTLGTPPPAQAKVARPLSPVCHGSRVEAIARTAPSTLSHQVREGTGKESDRCEAAHSLCADDAGVCS
jgi:hypothetical protein